MVTKNKERDLCELCDAQLKTDLEVETKVCDECMQYLYDLHVGKLCNHLGCLKKEENPPCKCGRHCSCDGHCRCKEHEDND